MQSAMQTAMQSAMQTAITEQFAALQKTIMGSVTELAGKVAEQGSKIDEIATKVAAHETKLDKLLKESKDKHDARDKAVDDLRKEVDTLHASNKRNWGEQEARLTQFASERDAYYERAEAVLSTVAHGPMGGAGSGAPPTDHAFAERLDAALTRVATIESLLTAAGISGDDHLPASPAPFVTSAFTNRAGWPTKTTPDPSSIKSKEESNDAKLFTNKDNHLKHGGSDAHPTLVPTNITEFLHAVRSYADSKGALPHDIKQYMSAPTIKLLAQSEEARGVTLNTTSTNSLEWIMAAANYLSDNGLDLITALRTHLAWIPSGSTVNETNVNTAVIRLVSNVTTAWNCMTKAIREDPTTRAKVTVVSLAMLPEALGAHVRQRLNINSAEDVKPSLTLEKLKEAILAAVKSLFADSSKTSVLPTLIVKNTVVPIDTPTKTSPSGDYKRTADRKPEHKAERKQDKIATCSYCTSKGYSGHRVAHIERHCRTKLRDMPSGGKTAKEAEDDDAASTVSAKSTSSHKSHKSATAAGAGAAIDHTAAKTGIDRSKGCPNCNYDPAHKGHTIADCHKKECRWGKSDAANCKKGADCPLKASHKKK